MPCNDVTETIRIVLDTNERLVSYRLRKSACDKAVGAESLLLDHLKNRSIPEILKLDPASLRLEYIAQNEIEDFLRLKHLFALQMAIDTFTGGQAGGGKNASCNIVEVNYGSDGIIIEADISVDIIAERIKACGPCPNVHKAT